jgi:hypothetical protein
MASRSGFSRPVIFRHGERAMRIEREMLLPDVLSRYPSCRRIFDRYGLTGCGGPRGPRETVAFFARAHQVDQERFLRELDQAAQQDEVAPGKLV